MEFAKRDGYIKCSKTDEDVGFYKKEEAKDAVVPQANERFRKTYAKSILRAN